MREILAKFRDLFSFSRRERPGILLLCVLLVITAALPLFFQQHPEPPSPELVVRADSFFQAAGAKDRERFDREREDTHGRHAVSLSWFDPNALSYSDWQKLGLPERTIRIILHYREKGGMFRRPEDLGRIWGLPPDQYARLKPFVRINSATRRYEEKDMVSERQSGHHTDTPAWRPRREFIARKPTILEVNQADSLQWLALPGIGEKLTSRILRFRERLGGFCTVDQVGETWGLPDSTFQKIRPMLTLSIAQTRKIPLNSAPEDLLQQHPYIRFRLARIIIRYRQEHGPFTAVADLRRIALITDDVYARLEPYCTIN